MLTLALLLIAAQDPTATPAPPPTPGMSAQSREHGVPISVLIEAVERASDGWTFVSPANLTRSIRLGAHTVPADPVQRLAWFRELMQIAGYAVVDVASQSDAFVIVDLREALPSLDLPRFTNADDLPAGTVLCDFEIRLSALPIGAAMGVTNSRQHLMMARYTAISGDTLILRDFAPTLRGIAETIARLDARAAESRRAIRVELALVRIVPGADPQETPIPPALSEAFATLQAEFGEGYLELLGMTAGRIDPSGESGVVNTVQLRLPVQTQEEDNFAEAHFSAAAEGDDVRLSDLEIVGAVSFETGRIILRAGEWEILASDGSGRSGFRILLVRAVTDQ